MASFGVGSGIVKAATKVDKVINFVRAGVQVARGATEIVSSVKGIYDSVSSGESIEEKIS